jgi:methanethiol S-methyltransferase
MFRVIAFLYSLAAYASFGLCLVYLLAFLLGVPGIAPVPGERPLPQSLLVNLLLLTGFALQHSVMARPGFKRWWTSMVPAPIERSTYVLVSSAVTFVLCWAWQPLPGMLWSAESPAGQVLWWSGFTLGLVVLLGSSFHIDHFDLLGLRQTWSLLRGLPTSPQPFIVRGLYRLVRHPIYVGWLLLFWCTPQMRTDHLLLAAGMTVYVLVAIRLEERDLVAEHGRAYAAYRRRVPALVPRPRQARRAADPAGQQALP